MEKVEKDYSFKSYFVRSQRCCGFLLQRGFILKGIAPDFNNPRFNVFRFDNSIELRNCIESYKSIPKNKPTQSIEELAKELEHYNKLKSKERGIS